MLKLVRPLLIRSVSEKLPGALWKRKRKCLWSFRGKGKWFRNRRFTMECSVSTSFWTPASQELFQMQMLSLLFSIWYVFIIISPVNPVGCLFIYQFLSTAPHSPVFARAAFLLECPHFVHRCNRGRWPCRIDHFIDRLYPIAGRRPGRGERIILQRLGGRMFFFRGQRFLSCVFFMTTI